ncbi:MAG: right-handed parallel beta-helix repeat-containing protein [Lentisphaerae bacterium]|nr:right-handed parallel beta-helix repeat-containing protein [Lentisphaerota bacterium]
MVELLIVWLLLAAINAQGATYYVSPAGNDANNGTSWSLAKQTIQAGINVAAAGDTVLVADGTYMVTHQIEVNQGITVRSVNGAQATTIDGGGVTRCAYLYTNAVLDGFTIKNGYDPDYGGGVYISGGMVRNCTISGNMAYTYYDYNEYFSGYYGNFGGGVYVLGGTVENCTINGNLACYGGGVWVENGLVKNCAISENWAFAWYWGWEYEGVFSLFGYFGGPGGGVYAVGDATVENCTISKNTSGYGGGVWLEGGMVQNCVIIGNTAIAHNFFNALTGGGNGGGVYAAGGTVQNCTISGNWSYIGGGVHAAAGGTVRNCTISENTACIQTIFPLDYFGHGGGVSVSGGTLENCTISENGAITAGGGVYVSHGILRNCTISGNGAYDCGGGGAFLWDGTLENCTISGNTAYWDGGGVLSGGTLRNCMISGNRAYAAGGGVYNFGTVKNCVISGNLVMYYAGWGGGVYNDGIVENCTITENTIFSDNGGRGVGGGVYVHSGTVRNCIAHYNQGNDVNGAISYSCSGTEITGAGNITNEPQFVSTGTGYGTNHVPGNYRLQPTSPCINAGINQPWMTSTTDLDGLPRIFGGVVDMGAYECPGTNSYLRRDPATLSNQCGYGSNAPVQTVRVWNDGMGVMAYDLSANVGWLSLSPASGASAGETDLVSGNYLTAGLLPGSYTGIVTITAAGALNSPQVVTVNLVVNKLNQTITFPAIPDQIVTSRVGLVATSSSGLPVSFAVVSGPGAITGGTNLTFSAGGTVKVVASQAGNSIWKAAPSVTNAVILRTLPPGVLQFAVTSVEGDEGGASVTLTVTRTQGSYGPAHVDYATVAGTATEGLDYQAASGRLSWPDGDAFSKTITVSITDDSIDENDEIFTVLLKNACGASLGPLNPASVTIIDNDATPQPGTIQFGASSYSVNENGGTVTLRVTREGGSDGPATVAYATAAGTASAGSDYTSQSGTLSWPAGDSLSRTITVSISDDSIDESDETFTVTLSNVTGAGLGSPSSAVVTIVDNDDPPVGQDEADLEVSDFKFVPVKLWAGDHPAEIEFVLVNGGPADIDTQGTQLEITFYLSSNQTFGDADDIAIGTKIEALNLPAGSQTTIRYPGRAHNEDVTIPEGLTGDYYVFVNVRLASSAGLSDPDGAYAMRDGPINVRIHPAEEGDNGKQRSVVNDYDGDEQTDMLSYDEPSGEWAVRLSASDENVRFIFGGPGFETVSGDYDGDGLTDPAIHQRAGSAWRIMLSGKGYQTVNFDLGGSSATRGAVGDYTGEGRANPGLYEETSGRWYVMLSEPGSGNAEIASAVFGGSGYLPVAGDYDGDRRTDPAVYGEATGDWQVLLSGQGYGVAAAVFGGLGYAPVVGDYDGDGRADPMLFNQATGEWTALMSANGYAPKRFTSGASIPVAGDFDGDGIADPAVLSTSGEWSFLSSASAYLRAGPYSLDSP